jgi:hypothetical protein
MSEQREFIDKGFEPVLSSNDIGLDAINAIQRWEMPLTGSPGLSLVRRKVAIWRGENQTMDGEFPVLAVSVEPNTPLRYQASRTSMWFWGIGSSLHLPVAPERATQYCLEIAEYQAEGLTVALKALIKQFPREPESYRPIIIALPPGESLPPPEQCDQEAC